MQKEVILKLPQVQQITGLTRDEITQKINAGTFPKPFKRNAWLKSHIDNWLKNQQRKISAEKVKNIFYSALLLFCEPVAADVYQLIKSLLFNK
jgi:predicted DNA-binding transcriptional regulator AlpA